MNAFPTFSLPLLRSVKPCFHVFLFVLLWSLGHSSAEAHRNSRQPYNRHFNHGQIRLVEPKIEKKKLVLWWMAPSGVRLRYVPKTSHSGWIARITHAIRDQVRYLAVGGVFFQSSNKGGWVDPTLVRRVKRVYRGVRPVKIDGRMPIYIATVIPRHKTDRLFVYKLWGRVHLNLEHHLNKVVCLYGVWFDFQGRNLGLVNQTLGVKGKPLHHFAKRYRFPKMWRHIWFRRKKLLRYQSLWEQGKQPKFPVKYVPTLSQASQILYRQQCKQRVTTIEAKATTPIDWLYHSPLAVPAFLPFNLPSYLYSLPGPPKASPVLHSSM